MQKRVEVFLEMLNSGEIEKVSVDAHQADALLRLLDAVVIKLEGGTEEDLKVLEVAAPKPLIAKEPIVIVKDKVEKSAKKEEEEKKVEPT